MLITALLSMLILVIAAYMPNPLCLLLSPIAVAALVFYSYTSASRHYVTSHSA